MIPSQRSEALIDQYSTDIKLRMRQDTHDRYSVPKLNFPEWILSRHPWRGDESILDVGTGTGIFADAVSLLIPSGQYHAFDQSIGMLESHPARAHAVVADATAIPFPDHSFDVVLANYVLHHIADIDKAMYEMMRVLKPNGVLIAATNSVGTMPELNFLFQRAMVLLSQSGGAGTITPLHNAFSLESGTRLLARHFLTVIRHDLTSALVFPHADPLIAYMDSTRSLREPVLPRGVYWDDVMLVMREQANRVIAALGDLTINKVSGVLIASDGGGAVWDFIRRMRL